MPFTLLDLNIIKSLNKIKLQAFNLKTYQLLSEANAFDMKRNLFTLGLSGKSIMQHKKMLIKDIRKNDSQSFKLHLQQYQTDCSMIKEQHAYEKQQEIFNQIRWEEINNQNLHNTRLSKLKKFWHKNSMTSHDSSMGLYITCTVILPLFQNFLQLARAEVAINKKKLPVQIYNDLKSHLMVLDKEIQDRQIQVCDAMVSRLQIASKENDIEFDDITHYMLKEYKNIGIHYNFSAKRKNGLTPQLFTYFHQYINQQGTSRQIGKLKKLHWFTEDNDYFSQEVDTEKVIIPKVMQKFLIPNKTKKWSFYAWHNWRGNFFKQHFYQLAKIRSLERANYIRPMTLDELLEGNVWKKMNQLNQEIKSEYHNAFVYQQSILNKIFSPKRVGFYKEWCQVNRRTLGKIVDKKIEYALLLSKELETRLTFDLDASVLYAEKTKKFLREIVKDIEDSNSSIRSDNEWRRIKEIFINTMDPLPKGKVIVKPGSTRIMLTKMQENKCRESTIHDNQHPILSLQDKLSLLATGNNFDFELINFKQTFSQLEEMLKHFQYKNEQDLQQFWIKFFTYYLRACLTYKNNDLENFRLVVNLLINLSPKSFKERVALLEKDRHASKFIYETRCQAMLVTLTETIKPQEIETCTMYINSK